jgi:hypothetical protein
MSYGGKRRGGEKRKQQKRCDLTNDSTESLVNRSQALTEKTFRDFSAKSIVKSNLCKLALRRQAIIKAITSATRYQTINPLCP